MIYVYRDHQYYGPYSREQALEHLRQGTFGSQDHARLKGADVFTTLGALVEMEIAAPAAKLESPPAAAPSAAPSLPHQPLPQKASLVPAAIWLAVIIAAGACVFSNKSWDAIRQSVATFAAAFRSETPPKLVAAPKPAATPEIPVAIAQPEEAPKPTPQPTAAVATPAPFSPAKIAGNRAAWPKTVKLLHGLAFPASFNGQVVGSVNVPAGMDVSLVNIVGDNLTLAYCGGMENVPWNQTDLEAAAARVPKPTPTPAPVPARNATPVSGGMQADFLGGKAGSEIVDENELFNSSVEGSALYGELKRAQYEMTPEVEQAYLRFAKYETMRQLSADDKMIPSDFLAWIDSDPIVQATVYGARKNAENVLLMLRSLDLDLGADAVRERYTQLALATAVVTAKDAPGTNITPHPPLKLVIPGDPRKPVNTHPVDRPLDVNDHIINFLEDHAPVQGEEFGAYKLPPEIKYNSAGVGIMTAMPAAKGAPKVTRPLYAADVLESKELQDEFNAYMAAHGQSVRIDCGERVITPNSHDGISGPYAQGILDAYKLFKTAYESKGRLPADRDIGPTPGERCAYLIRNDAGFPSGSSGHRWTHYPLTAPWPTLTLLAAYVDPLRERDEIYQRYAKTGQVITYGEYIGGIAQQYDYQSARRLTPYPFTYGSFQMMMKDGGVCGTMAAMEARTDNALGTPACQAGQPGHCALIHFTFDNKTRMYRCEGAQYVTGGDDDTHPFVPWVFGDTDDNRDMVWYQTVAWGVNESFQSYLDSMVALDIYKLLPEQEQKAHGLKLLESGLSRNRYNFALVEAAIADAGSAQDRQEFRNFFKGLFSGTDTPGRPIKGLYNTTVDKLIDKAGG